MKKHILVTGINGFVGKHLAGALVDNGFIVSGIIREKNADPKISGLVQNFITCDLVDSNQTSKLDLSPYQAIINLAGLANVAQSFSQPDLYMKVNVSVLTNICQRVYDQRLQTRVLAISTGAVYDNSQPMPLSEDSKLTAAGSPYAQSKIAMEAEARKFRGQGVDCIIARPFNHIGPGQLPGFLIPDLITRVKNSLKQGQPLIVGNLKTRRDYTDVRNVVKAYIKLATMDLKHDTYNICSGHSMAGEEILKLILEEMDAKDLKVEIDSSLIRPDDPDEIFGSFERLKFDTGWQPVIPVEKTIEDSVKSYLDAF